MSYNELVSARYALVLTSIIPNPMYNFTTTSPCVTNIHVLYQEIDPMQQPVANLLVVLVHVLCISPFVILLCFMKDRNDQYNFRLLKILLMARNMT
jgi:hypothetical protein